MKKILFLLTGFLTSLALLAQEGQFAPLNPDFVRFQESLKTQEGKKSAAESRFGYVPSPLQLNFANYKGINSLQSKKGMSVPLPSRFDLRDSGFVTPAKNQGNGGTCWAFAAIGAVESNWLVNHWGIFDLSEQNMAACNGIIPDYDWGGNFNISSAYLTRFTGPVLEVNDPYRPPGLCSNKKFQVPRFVLTSRQLPADMELVKRTIMSYGAVCNNMLWIDNSYNAIDKTFYYDGNMDFTNHDVLLIGWDDEKIITGGSKSPKGTKGAWIVKNSWGTGWGEDGFFYISYYDKLALSSIYHFDASADTTEIDKINIYNDLGASMAFGYEKEEAWGLTRFHAAKKEIIKKIGTYIISAASSIDIEIYSNFKDGKLTGLIYEQKDIPCEFPGQRVFNVFAIVEGEYFVKIRYNTPSWFYPIPVETQVKAYLTPLICQTGYNWISEDGLNWEEIGLGVQDREMDLTIRSYTSDAEKTYGFFDLPVKQLCLSNLLSVSAELSDSSVSCKWKFLPDGIPLDDTGQGPVTTQFSSPGIKEVILIIHSQDIDDTISQTLEVVSSLDIEISHSYELTQGYSEQIYPEKPRSALGESISLYVQGDADRFEWNSPFDTVNNSVITVTPEHVGQNLYYVKAYQENCYGYDTISVEGFLRPENDDIINSLELHVNENGPFTSINSSYEKNEPLLPIDNLYYYRARFPNTVWFWFTAFREDSINIFCEGFDNEIAIYEAENGMDILNGEYNLLDANFNYDFYYKRTLTPTIKNLKGLTIGKKYWLQISGAGGRLEGIFNLRLTQSKYFNTSEDTIFLACDSGSIAQLIIETDTTWTISSPIGWLGFSPNNSQGRDTVSIFSKSDNRSGKVRNGYITIKPPDIAIETKKIIIVQDFVTGIEKLTKSSDLLLYPNPASTELDIKGLDASHLSACTFTICDITGRVLNKVLVNNNGKIDVSGLSKGLYFLKITEDRNPIAVLRFMKE